jgi:hypothetical protein
MTEPDEPRHLLPMDTNGLEEIPTTHLLCHRRLLLGVRSHHPGCHHELVGFDDVPLLPRCC